MTSEAEPLDPRSAGSTPLEQAGNPGALDPLALRAHVEALGRLARALVSDVHLAEDMAQEALLRALERRPRVGSPRRWLATVLRRRVRDETRGAGRRRSREEAVAREELLEASPDAIAERLELEGLLARTVAELEEPVRATLFLRYWEDRPPSWIARTQGVPVATVKTRLRRGLAQLRGRLAAHSPEENERLGLLLLALAGRAPVAPLRLGAVALMLVGAVAATAVGWIGIPVSESAPQPTPVATAPAMANAGSSAPSTGAPEPPLSTSRHAADGDATVGSEGAPALFGRLVDFEGRPLAKVRVRHWPTAQIFLPEEHSAWLKARTTRTDREGRFAFDSLDEKGAVSFELLDGELELIVSPAVEAPSARELLLVAHAPRPTHGRVVDQYGSPVGGALLEAVLPRDAFAALGFSEPPPGVLPWMRRVDEDGSFAWSLPDRPGLQVRASRADRLAVLLPASAFGSGGTRALLPRPPAAGSTIRGRVVDPGGSGVPFARVALGGSLERTDEEGRFVLDGGRAAEDATEVLAFVPGRLPGRAPLADGAPLELRIGGPTAGLKGSILLPSGEPAAFARVCELEPTLVERRPEGWSLLTDHLNAGPFSNRSSRADGSFVLRGLEPRPQSFLAYDPKAPWRRARFEARPGGEPVRVVLADEPREAFEGLLLDPEGAPLPSVFVRASWSPPALEDSPAVKRAVGELRVVTDAGGRFRFDALPTGRLRLSLSGDAISDQVQLVDHPADLASTGMLELTLPRAASLAVVPPERAVDQWLSFADGEGVSLAFHAPRLKSTGTSYAVPLDHPGLEGLRVPETARTLRVHRGGRLLVELPLALDPARTLEDPNRIRW